MLSSQSLHGKRVYLKISHVRHFFLIVVIMNPFPNLLCSILRSSSISLCQAGST